MGELDYFWEMMATTGRHSKLIGKLVASINRYESVDNGEIEVFQDGPSIAYDGEKHVKDSDLKLIDLATISDLNEFRKEIPVYESFIPDFMYFKKGNFVFDYSESRFAGYPELIVEVWSKGNSKIERILKKHIYSTSPITEHWYIEQDSNIVECWLGQVRLPDKNLTEILIDHNGYEFDLRHLAIKN